MPRLSMHTAGRVYSHCVDIIIQGDSFNNDNRAKYVGNGKHL